MLAIGINLLAADDSGWSNSDRITNVTQPRFEVTVDQPGQIGVDFNADGTSDIQQSVDAAGTYEFRSSTLSDGNRTLAATFTPLTGDVEQASMLVTIDTQGPKLTRGPIVVASPYFQRTLTFDENIVPTSLTADDVAFSTAAGDAVPVTGVAGADKTYTISFAPVTAQGDYELNLGPQVRDLAGNPMNQDGDSTNGEAGQDVAHDSFTVLAGATWLTSKTTISETDTTYENRDLVVSGATLTVAGQHTFNSLYVVNTGTVTHAAANTAGMQLTISDDLAIDATSRITVDGVGYAGGYTSSGQGPEAGGRDSANAGGGGHGGVGGGPLGGAANDSPLAPTGLGSGGGGSSRYGRGGSGGGAIRLIVTDRLTLDGSITANGLSGAGTSDYGQGGGAGGSIWVTAGTLAGSGVLQANGGNGYGGYWAAGGGGGGGGVAVYYQDGSGFSGYSSSTATGGAGAGPGGAGAPGTVAFIDQTILQGHLHVYTTFELPRDATAEFGAMTVHVGGTLTARGSTTLTAGRLSVNAGGVITAAGTGYGPGQALGVEVSDTWNGGGGGYGGVGGTGGATGGPTYGSALEPTDPGSGGGHGYRTAGGSGGGAIRLIISGTLALNGTIRADGTAGVGGTNGGGGGGSGGSIWVTTQVLSGSGRFHADGGTAGPSGASDGGGGGGGRIAVYYSDASGFNEFVASTATGGAGAGTGSAGAPGTVAFIDQTILQGHLHVYTTFELPRDATAEFGAVTVHAGATLAARGSTTLTAGSLSVEVGGVITSNGEGYAGGNGSPGQGPGAGGLGGLSAGGGGHGGVGGGPYGGAAGDLPLTPTDLGSGGGSGGGSSEGSGGSGGGAIRLIVSDRLTLDGSITANGLGGTQTPNWGHGGGAGGSIWVTAGTLAGSGALQANGGNGYAYSSFVSAGGGGGGCVAVYYQDGSVFSGYSRSTAMGGAGAGSGSAGAPGTVAFVDQAIPQGHLHVYTTFELRRDATAEFGAVTVHAGGTFTTRGSTTLQCATLTVHESGQIATDGAGYGGEQGPGVGVSNTWNGGGGGYGGAGGSGGGTGGGAGGPTYGSALEPSDLGSGGGHGYGAAGGAGGGAIRLIISGTLTLDGMITAAGTAGVGGANGGGGGGSGGSIWVTTRVLAGRGCLQADGGAGGAGGAGHGGGGRIAVYYHDASGFGGYDSSTASGGTAGNVGAVGSVGFIDESVPGRHLRVYTAFSLPRNETLNAVSQITIAENASLWVSGATTIQCDALTVRQGGRITADGTGNGQAQGPGAGGNARVFPNGSGGGYGGAGGAAQLAAGGAAYGSALAPADPGSGGGGGNGPGGSGGGAIRLIIADTLELEGTITANGTPGGSFGPDGGGGGSGGSIWVTTQKLTGEGSFHADGGAAGASGAGSGGGGRIAVFYRDADVVGDSTAAGGRAGTPGQSGTVNFWREVGREVLTATPNERIFFDVQQVAGSRAAFVIQSPTGDSVLTTVANAGSPDEADSGPLTLSETGTYVILVYGTIGSTPSYQYRVWPVAPAETHVLHVDLPATGAISSPGAVQDWLFTVQSNCVVSLNVGKITGSGQVLDFTLQASDGSVITTSTGTSSSPQSANVGPVILTQAGAYTLVVDGRGDDMAAYQITLLEPDSPRVLSHLARGNAPGIVDSVWFYFDQPMDTTPNGFDLVADLLDFRAATGQLTATSARWDDDRTLVVSFSPQPANNSLSMLLGPNILSAGGMPLDQDADFIPGEIPDDEYSADLVADTKGPRVSLTQPVTMASAPLDQFVFYFNEPIDPRTFSLGDVTEFSGPGGVDLRGQLTNFIVDAKSLTVFFAVQSVSGTYSMTIGPQITDLAGNLIDQNQDGTPDGFTLPIDVRSADLAVVSVGDPVPSVYGDRLNLTWTVRNIGGDAAQGVWWDYVYLSADDRWDLSDVLVGKVAYNSDSRGTVAANGGTYQGTLAVTMPGVLPGNYRVIARSNLLRGISEADFANNTGASSASAHFDLPALTSGVPVSGDAAVRQAFYYRIDVPNSQSGSTLLVRFGTDELTVANELYVSYDHLPTRQVFDARSDQGLRSNQWLSIPKAQAGTYFILALAAPDRMQLGQLSNCTVQADILGSADFSVMDSYFGMGGTAGNRTIEIDGRNFDRTIIARLTDAAGASSPAVDYYRVGPEKLYATFDLTTVAPGTYDVVFENWLGQRQVVAAGFEVVRTTSLPEVNPVATSPPAFRSVRHTPLMHFPLSVTWRNDGMNDAPAPIILTTSHDVFGRDLAAMLATFTGLYPDLKAIPGVALLSDTFFGLAAGDGPPGILMPGQSGSITYHVIPRLIQNVTTANQNVIFSARPLYGDVDEVFNWDWEKASLNSSYLSPEEFDATFAQFKIAMGSTNADYLRVLSQSYTVLPSLPQDFYDATKALVQEAFDRFAATVLTSIRGRIDYPAFDIDVTKLSVTAINRATGQSMLAPVRRDGDFVFPSLVAGEYELTVAGGAVASSPHFKVALATGEHAEVAIPIVSGGTVTGTVQAAAGGQGIGDAAVRIVAPDLDLSYYVTSQADGTFTITDVYPGSYQLSVSGGSFVDFTATITVVPNHTFNQVITLDQGATLTGSVTDQETGAPIQEAQVLARNNESGTVVLASTHADGSYELPGLSIGQWAVSVSHADYIDSEAIDFAVTNTSTLTQDIGIGLGGSISGVVRGEDGTPQDSTLVEVQGAEYTQTVFTDADGRHTVTRVPPGDFQIQVRPTDWAPASLPVHGLANQENRTDVDVTLLKGISLSGVVLNTSGEALAGARILLIAGDRNDIYSQTSQSDGVFSFAHLSSGSYECRVSRDGYLDHSRPITVSADRPPSLPLILTRAGSVYGVVRDSQGLPVAEALVLIKDVARDLVQLDISDTKW